MDSNDATILALSLGIPSATFLSIAFLLALRIQHRQLQARETPTPHSPYSPYRNPSATLPSCRPILWHPTRAATTQNPRTLTTLTNPARRLR